MNVRDTIKTITTQLMTVCADKQTAHQEAWWLLEKAMGKKQTTLITDGTLSNKQEQMLLEWVRQRVQNKKPLQYILGSVPFCNLEILVEPPILIPRPETEEWVTWLISQLENKPLNILDIGAGSGAIALALAQVLPEAQVTGIDINEQAIALANKNKAHNNITNATFLMSDLFEQLHDKTFDLIVSNPPYITEKEYATLNEQVTRWEDKQALVANDEGLAIYKQIIQDASNYLNATLNTPNIVLEIGYTQGPAVSMLLEKEFVDITVHQDLEGKDRWISAYKRSG